MDTIRDTHSPQAVMRLALKLEPNLDPDVSEVGRFERCADRPLALALDVIRGHGFQDDFAWDANDTAWDRIGRWLVADTEDGFMVVEEFTDAEEAIRALRSLELDAQATPDDDDAPLDMDARYSVAGYRGIAFYLLGYVERETCDTEWTGEKLTDTDWVRAVMVGDDRVHEVEVADLTPLDDADYCGECGQIGCGHG